ncbi:hypothetical protein PSY47_23375, partial [Shigella flexneri]|nr:hypothetical protein [Shigella flexneri]
VCREIPRKREKVGVEIKKKINDYAKRYSRESFKERRSVDIKKKLKMRLDSFLYSLKVFWPK